MVLEVCHLQSCQFSITSNVQMNFRHMGYEAHSTGFSVRKVILRASFGLIILNLCLLLTSLSMKSSVVPARIIALILTYSVSLFSCILTMRWSLSFSRFSMQLSAG